MVIILIKIVGYISYIVYNPIINIVGSYDEWISGYISWVK